MLSIIAFAAAGLTLLIGLRYLIQRWLGADPDEDWLDRGEVRMRSSMRWFTGLDAESGGLVRWRRGPDGQPERIAEDRPRS